MPAFNPGASADSLEQSRDDKILVQYDQLQNDQDSREDQAVRPPASPPSSVRATSSSRSGSSSSHSSGLREASSTRKRRSASDNCAAPLPDNTASFSPQHQPSAAASAASNGSVAVSMRPAAAHLSRHVSDESFSSFGSSHQDLPNQLGNTGRHGGDQSSRRPAEIARGPGETPAEIARGPGEAPPPTPPPFVREAWEINYREAAIFLEEGQNNDKFTNHPRSSDELPAYLLVHNKWFNFLDLVAAVVLLGLGVVEDPCDNISLIPPQVHGAIELCALVLIGIEVFLKTRWIGWRTFYKHRRTSLKVVTLTIMVVEAVVVIIRRNNHFRVTRALRPLFLIDNHFCGGIRRFLRQIFLSLPPIIDMLGLVMFVTLIYSVFAFYLFSTIDPNRFDTLLHSFVSLFVLLTTANYPDVMMKSYHRNMANGLFFVSYLCLNLYFLMNLMLAVVYDAFTTIEKEKFRRLFLHKRKAAQHAFRLLVTKERPDEISYRHFLGLMTFYKRVRSPTEAYLIFKLLNTSKSRFLKLDEFYGIYDACTHKWQVGKVEKPWFEDFWEPVTNVLSYVRKMVTSTWFEYTVCLVVLANGAILLVQTSVMESSTDSQRIYAPWVSFFFVGLYTLEAALKLLGLGCAKYFKSHWNCVDFFVTALGVASLILEVEGIPLFFVTILRSLRLLTLFRMKKRFRDVFGTAVILLPRLTSAAVVLLLVYYFFGIIGIEVFRPFTEKLVNCCVNETVEAYFKYDNDSGSNMYFYLNNFQCLPKAYFTLFELTVVNNWYVIMDGFTIVTSTDWTRVFFMAFYLFTMIVMTIIVAFILEAFLFRIRYKAEMSKSEALREKALDGDYVLVGEMPSDFSDVTISEKKRLSKEIFLLSSELEDIVRSTGTLEEIHNSRIPPNSSFLFVGVQSRTKGHMQSLMYKDEMETWIADFNDEEVRFTALAAGGGGSDGGSGESTTTRELSAPGGGAAAINGDGGGDAGNEFVQLVRDDDHGEVTTIRRPMLIDFH